MYQLASKWLKWLSRLASVEFLLGIGIVSGTSPVPTDIPLVHFARQHVILAFVVGAILVAVTVGAWLFVRKPASLSTQSPRRLSQFHLVALAVTTGTSFATTGLLIGLVALVLTKPAWCPASVCPQPPGPHDQNLEADFTAMESSAFAIIGDPGQYSLSHPPATRDRASVAAQRIDLPDPAPYRVVVRVHNLQQGRFSMIIEQVALVVVSTKAPPDPQAVWLAGSPITYRTNPFHLTYRGQQVGTLIPATNAGPFPEAHVQLAPGEADVVTLELSSAANADLTYRIAITYRIANEDRQHTLTLPYDLHALFTDGLDWHPYRLEGGHLVPA
jgi:hypothetical protein